MLVGEVHFVAQDIVEKLKKIIEKNHWESKFKDAVVAADLPDIHTLEEYYNWIDYLVKWVPVDENYRKELYGNICKFYWFLDQEPVKSLQKNEELNKWMDDFARDWGKFLDTPESINDDTLETFKKMPNFDIEIYAPNPSGWKTFNQFFARQVKPGARPIDDLCDDNIIVSPADCTPVEIDKITNNSIITAKGLTFSILELLKDSPYQRDFDGGTFMHSFLNVNDYHRYHVPVGGTVLEVRDISGSVFLDVRKDEETGELKAEDGTGYQFTQARGLVVLDSPIGKVAVLPIGMAQVSSCILTVEKNMNLFKGQEFGYFQFGGSDIIVLFSKDCDVEITAVKNRHYNQGKKVGHSKKN